MADDLLSLMQQWMKQLEQQRATAGEDPLDAWFQMQQALQPLGVDQLPPQQAELVSLLTRQSIEFSRFAEQIISQLEHSGSETELSALLNQFHGHLRRLTQEWILKRWQLPEQLGALFHTHSFQDDLLLDNPFIHGLKSLLNTPSQLGLQHSLQTRLQTGIDLLIEYEQALRDYSAHYSAINTDATRGFLTAIEQADPPIQSIGELHDLWVEAYEQSYADTIASDDYRDAHGRISNAVMSLRRYLQHWRNNQLQQFGIPSAEQLERIHQRLHEQRRQLKALNREVQALRTLRDEVTELKQQLNRSRRSGTRSRKQTDTRS